MAGRTGAGEKEEAFRAVFDTYYPELCRRLVPFLGDHAAVEDVAQEAFLKLYYRPPPRDDNVPAWLFRVAVNLTYNQIRADERRRKREQGAYEQPAGNWEDEVLRREEIAGVREALSRLAPRDRFCLLLRFEGYGYSEIAAVLQVEPGSVGTIIARARERFRREYSAGTPEPQGPGSGKRDPDGLKGL
ncbi:MAG: sigma-70 family RNA polymerase sigma factor [Bacillota bacterium]